MWTVGQFYTTGAIQHTLLTALLQPFSMLPMLMRRLKVLWKLTREGGRSSSPSHRQRSSVSADSEGSGPATSRCFGRDVSDMKRLHDSTCECNYILHAGVRVQGGRLRLWKILYKSYILIFPEGIGIEWTT